VTIETAQPSTGAESTVPEFFNPSSYFELADFINQHVPYAAKYVLPDLTNKALIEKADTAKKEPHRQRPARVRPARQEEPGRLDRVDVFGALWQNGRHNPVTGVKVDPDTGAVDVPGRPVAHEKGIFQLRVPTSDGGTDSFQITKGLRIPYKYTTEYGEEIYANIFVLFNGTGH